MLTAISIYTQIRDRQDFTYSKNQLKRYIVGAKNVPDEVVPFKLVKLLDSLKDYDTFGGWLDTDTGKYYLDIGKSFDNLRYALKIAKKHNKIR